MNTNSILVSDLGFRA